MMQRLSRTLIFSLALFCALPCLAQKNKVGFSLTQVPDQWAQLREVPEVVADQKCENWAWAAGVETILRKEEVALDQKFWIDKLSGGALCQPSAGAMEDLAKVVDGEYILGVGRKYRLQSRYISGVPTSTDRLLVPLALGHPYILWWKQHAYIVDGALWNESIYPNGQKRIEMKELSLLDPFVGGEKRKTKFVMVKDQPNDIGGIFEVSVTPIDEDSPWKK